MTAPASTSSPRGLGLADFCIRRPVFATMINLLFVVLGWMAFRDLGIDQLPNVELPIVTVTTTLRGASPEEVETGVTKPLEEIINTVQGIDELSSSSREGVSFINAQFVMERNRDLAAQDVRDKVNTILSRLPAGTEPPIIDKFDVDAVPVLTLAISAPRELKEVTYVADKSLKQNLETVSDVGAISIGGARVRAVQVSVDIDRLRAYGLTIEDVRTALEEQNIEVPGGRVEQGSRELVLRTLGRMQTVADFERLIVANSGGQPIYLSLVGTVKDDVEEPRSLARLNGENAVTLVVRKQSGSNTVKLIDALKARLEQLRPLLPADFKAEIIRDQSRFIRRNLHEVSLHLVLGMILVAVTVYVFLHDWRGTLIACVAIPASIVSSFTLMKLMGYTLNNSTMLGLTFSVGVVIDDAIVVLENIHRNMEERGWNAFEAALEGTREIAPAVLATTLSLVVIFLPLGFMKGRTGLFFSSYGITCAFAIMVSLFISFTLTPMLASRFLRHTDDERIREKKAHGGALMKWLSRFYGAILEWSLAHRWAVVLASAACVASLCWLVPMSKVTFMPRDDSSEFEVGMTLPEGTSLSRASEICADVEQELKALRWDGKGMRQADDIQASSDSTAAGTDAALPLPPTIGKQADHSVVITDTLTTIGATSGRVGKGEGDVTQASIYCRLPELGGRIDQLTGRSRRWSQEQAMSAARRIMTRYPDLRSSVRFLSPLSGGGPGGGAEIQFNILGPDLAKLSEFADGIIEKMRAETALADIDTSLSNRKPELQVHIDRDKASQFGFRVEEIATALRTIVGGEIVGSFRENDDLYDVWLRAEQPDRSTAEVLRQVTLRSRPTTPGGRSEAVQLANLVRLEEARGPNQIERYQRQRRITVFANLGPMALGEAMSDVKRIASRLNLPADYSVAFTGRARQFEDTLRNFMIAFVVALVFMYMILAAQFEHFIHPVSIMLAVPLALPFALGWMIFINEQLSIYAIFGLFMLAGIVKKNGILQVDYSNTLRSRGMPRDDAIILANKIRLRPIMMTTMLLVVSMIPIALGVGPGAAGRAAMAKVIIGGQLLCLLLTLLVTPVSYAIFDDWGRGVFWRRKKSAEAP